jgi:hypothetical protein
MNIDAKEKAKELIENYYDGSATSYGWSVAKHHALIAVDEILNEQLMFGSVRTGRFEYWTTVKEEINKL